MKKSPIIIVGMHRSGTTLLSKILEQLGVFMGWKKEENNEALFFLKFNDWLLKQANSTWDNTYNYTIASEDFKNFMVVLAKKYISSIRRVEYLGPFNFLKYKTFHNLDIPWGWKDPRNSFTIDVWLKVFPNAKVVHIYRNPIDVAESLRKRALKHKRKVKWNLKKELCLLLTTGYIGYGHFIREENIFEGIKLWEEYASNVFKLEKKLEINFLHIKYEDLLSNPQKELEKVLNILELPFRKERLEKLIKSIKSDRKYAFLKDKSLVEICKQIKNKELVIKLGYDTIC